LRRIDRLIAREGLAPDTILDEPALKPLWREMPALTPLARDGLDPISAEQRLAAFSRRAFAGRLRRLQPARRTRGRRGRC
jgi:hypothetical protein